MPSDADRETLIVDGREIAVSNPRKILFPDAGYTKLDLARYYVAVSRGALRAAGGRPNVLVRYPNGVGGEFFYQKRAPASRPPWIDVVSLHFPSGRTAEEVVPRNAAALVWMANLACLELHPHPVRADDLEPAVRRARVVDEARDVAADGRVAAPAAVHTEDPDAAVGEVARLARLAFVVPDELARVVDDARVLSDPLDGEHAEAVHRRSAADDSRQPPAACHPFRHQASTRLGSP